MIQIWNLQFTFANMGVPGVPHVQALTFPLGKDRTKRFDSFLTIVQEEHNPLF